MTFANTPVSNFGGQSLGQMNLVAATADSVNTIYMQLNDEIGPEKTAAAAAALGIDMDDRAKSAVSNVLGSSAVNPLQMAQAYAALANGGTVRPAHFVAEVRQGDETRYRAGRDKDTTPFSEQAVADTVYAMQAVTKSGGTAASVGKAFGNRPIAGKTGTTNDSKAAWFNGFTPQLETAVVLYNPGPAPDYEELGLGRWGGVKSDITGGTIPAKIWTSYMTKALKDTKVEKFASPSKQVSSSPSPTATATPTPTDTASATPTGDPSASPSESPTDGEDGATEGPTEDAGDTPQAAGAPSIADRAAARLGAAAQAAQGGPGQGRGAGGPAAGPGAGRAQG
ncbi:penicillin-binding transpeptidase domain-containing protein [Quadrisphaera sp. INWT6]|uniref:penicillin-binding transpeptidase domain-containing protein n=1 Tax=Quadrisphaera sp. INWT6 TaxID=2596917 RepID=UPI0018926C53|nr:penicillin-binding transpeptidase domain-containing protein [Quadrisphaera sp. INWT6]MBF5083294.1 penicillin-binding protein [Quadrisphaera sp. INWT6]